MEQYSVVGSKAQCRQSNRGGSSTDTDFLARGMSRSTFRRPCLDVVEIGFIELFVERESLRAGLIR